MAIDPKSPDGFPTDQINDWVFDLDNTIYPAKSNLFVRVAVRITAFVAQHFKVPEDEARVIQKDLFQRYGTTMRGLMVERGLTPEEPNLKPLASLGYGVAPVAGGGGEGSSEPPN